MRMTYHQKIELAKSKGIIIPNELKDNRNYVGIYKFFKIKDNEKHCFYVGKATDIAYRLLGASGGHIYMYLNNNYSKCVPRMIKEYLNDGYEIEVEFESVDYCDSSFTRAAHRLALAELKAIVEYQKKGECLFQTPEGVGKRERKFWKENYKI